MSRRRASGPPHSQVTGPTRRARLDHPALCVAQARTSAPRFPIPHFRLPIPDSPFPIPGHPAIAPTTRPVQRPPRWRRHPTGHCSEPSAARPDRGSIGVPTEAATGRPVARPIPQTAENCWRPLLRPSRSARRPRAPCRPARRPVAPAGPGRRQSAAPASPAAGRSSPRRYPKWRSCPMHRPKPSVRPAAPDVAGSRSRSAGRTDRVH